MGGGVSKYRMTDLDDGHKVEAVDTSWLAARGTVIGVLKPDAFRSKTALGDDHMQQVVIPFVIRSIWYFCWLENQ